MKYFLIFLIITMPTLSSESTGFKEIIKRECRKNNISIRMWTNLIQAESSGNPRARGKLIRVKVNGEYIWTRAIGLCQVIPELHYPGKPKEDLEEPGLNIRLGMGVYKQCLKRSNGNVITALRRYNGQKNNKDNKYINKILRGVKI